MPDRGLFRTLIDTSDFPARWNCGKWTDLHGWVHIASDLAIFGAYAAIPLILIVFVRRRPDAPFPAVFWLFGLFIFSCGTGHLVEASIFWKPWYRLSGLVKVLTALASWGTVLALVPIVPRALALPGLAVVNSRLEEEIKERRRTERRYVSLLKATASVVFVADGAGNFAEPQSAWEAFTGQPFGAHRGRGWLEALHPEDREPVGSVWDLAVAQRDVFVASGRIWSARRGEYRWFEARAVPIEDERGEAIEWVGTITEVHDRRLAEERYRCVVEEAPIGMVKIDAEGRILLVNAEAERMFGYGREELLGQPIEVLVPERFRGQHPGHRAEFLKDPQARAMGVNRDLFGLRADGSEFPVEIGLNPIVIEGGLAVLSSIMDMTERRRAEEQIRRKNRDLETLLHVTSHDLREPLRAIQSFAHMVHERYAARLDDKGKDFLERIRRGADRMERLIGDILTLSRAQRLEAPVVEVAGEEIVAEALARLESRIQATGARIRVAPGLPRLRAERAWATQALYNLVSNALKFCRPGESPDVEIRPHGKVGFVVADRGIGIRPEHSEQIFQLFQRGVGREVEGTGAGLAIVRQIAERHGGMARARVRQGGGAEFVITFGPDAAGEER